MKAKQKTIRIFDIEIESENDFFLYMDKNLILLKEYLLLLRGSITPKVTEYLEKHNICFVLAEKCNLKLSTKTNQTNKSDIIIKDRSNTINSQPTVNMESTKKCATLLLEKTIRSGEEVVFDGDITIFGRVNSAAKVIAEGSVEVYGVIDGLVQCDGSYMIVKELGKGHIIFNGDILEKEQFDGNLKKVTKSPKGAVIKDIF